MKWFQFVIRVADSGALLSSECLATSYLPNRDVRAMRRWPSRSRLHRSAWAVALLAAIFVFAGCNDYGNTFQSPTGAAIGFIAPTDANAGGQAFTMTVSSPTAGFVSQTVVQWNGKTIPTTFVSTTTVTATVAPALIAKPGIAFINTLNPFSGTGNNGLSNVLSFLINPTANPVPAITAISPNSSAAGGASFTLTVTGSNFILTSDPSGGSQARWNLGGTQTNLPVLAISTTQITATVDASLLVNTTTQPVSAIITVFNPPAAPTTPVNGGVPSPTAGGGGTSPGGLAFTISPSGASPANTSRAAIAEETPAVSVDGRYVAYTATQGEHAQVFVRDTCEGTSPGCQSRTMLISSVADGTAANDDSRSPSMSSDGRYIAFSSSATNLATAAASATGSPVGRQVYLRDTCVGATSSSCTPSTQLVSTDSQGALVGTEGLLPSVSASGRFVAFLAVTPSHTSATSSANKSAAKSAAAASGATANSGYRQVFVRDTCIGVTSCTPKTTRISLQPGDTSTTDVKPAGPAITGSATHVAVPGANLATIFTHSVAVDDRVFLALTGSHP
jgi:hypothetical protein